MCGLESRWDAASDLLPRQSDPNLGCSVWPADDYGPWSHRGCNGCALESERKGIASSSQDQTVKQWNLRQEPRNSRSADTQERYWLSGGLLSGRKIATASEDHLVKVWDAETSRLIKNLKGHSEVVHAVAWSPDGTRLASAGDDRVIVVWNSTTGERIRTLTGHTAKVESLAWSQDSSKIASAGHDEMLRVWNAAREKRFELAICFAQVGGGMESRWPRTRAGVGDGSAKFSKQ